MKMREIDNDDDDGCVMKEGIFVRVIIFFSKSCNECFIHNLRMWPTNESMKSFQYEPRNNS